MVGEWGKCFRLRGDSVFTPTFRGNAKSVFLSFDIGY